MPTDTPENTTTLIGWQVYARMPAKNRHSAGMRPEGKPRSHAPHTDSTVYLAALR